MNLLPKHTQFTAGFLLILLLTICFWSPVHAQQQQTEWLERETTYFILLYTPEDKAEADKYANFVDQVYEDVSVIFNYRTEPPITVRLYPSHEAYIDVNPLAPKVEGIIAHADFRHREVAVILTATERQTPQEVENNVRHELTHIIAAELSDNRLNTGFQEGIAQYIEKEPPGLERKVQMLSQARDQGLLMDWSMLEDREVIYNNPKISYPQTLSIVSFLIEHYGFSKFRDFLTITGRSSGYRSALQRTYEKSPADMEAEWLDWLPSFIDGGYQQNAVANYDLSHARQLLELGRYADARSELEQAISWLRTRQEETETDDVELDAIVHDAEALLARSKRGEQAEQRAADARTALQQGEYTRAEQLIAEARAIYAELDDHRQDAVLDTFQARVERGLQAREAIEQARRFAGVLKFPQARQAADKAVKEFALLGDTERWSEAVSLRRSLDSRQHLAGMLLLGLGVMGVGVSLGGRWALREEEAW